MKSIKKTHLAYGIALISGALFLSPSLWAADTKSVSDFLVNTTTAGTQTIPAVGMDASGNFVVVWFEPGDTTSYVYGQRFNSAGTKLGSEFEVSNGAINTQDAIDVAMNGNGDFIVTWSDSDYVTHFKGYDSDGSVTINETTSDGNLPEVAIDSSGNFVITCAYDGLTTKRYNSSGTLQGNAISISNIATDISGSFELAMDTSGNFIVVFTGDAEGDYGIEAQRYNASGVAQGAAFTVNTYTTGDQYEPSIAMDDSGNFVVVWQSPEGTQTNEDIIGQRFNSSGATVGDAFTVTTFSDDDTNPQVAMDANGNFVVTWTSILHDGAGYGVYALRYDSSGNPVGTEFLVNSYTTADQWRSAVAASSLSTNYEYVAAWAGAGTSDSGGIYAAVYSSGGASATPEPTTFLYFSLSGIFLWWKKRGRQKGRRF